MSRSLTTAMEAATLADVVRPVVAVEADFGSGTLRVNSSPYALTIGGAMSIGVGQLGGITPVEETGDLGAYQMAVILRGVPRELVSTALAESYQGRSFRMFFATLDASHVIVADPVMIFAGRMDNMQIRMGGTAEITLSVENRLADWDRERIRRYTDPDQQAEHPGDRFFEYVPAMQEKDLQWGRS